MRSNGTSRTRLAIILALSVLMWSDAALAALVCAAHGMGCYSGSSHMDPAATDASNLQASDTEMRAMPCCPGSGEVAMQCSDPAMNCCTLEQGGRDPAVVSKSTSVSSRPDASVSAAVVTAGPAAWQQTENNQNNAALYVKPVNQRKTDLRI